MLDVPTVHVVEFFDEVNERLRLHESLAKLFLVFRFGVLFEIEDVVGGGLVVGCLDVARFGMIVLLFAVFGILLVEVFKVIDQIKQEIQEKLLDTKRKLALMQLLFMHIVRVAFLVSLIGGDLFLFFIHVIYASLKLLEHESDVRLRLRGESLLVLDRLRVKVEDHDVLVHAVPLAREDFRPKLLGETHEKWEWGIEVIDGDLRREVSHQLAGPIERKQECQERLHNHRIHRDVVVDQDDLALVDDANEDLNKELRLYPHEKIVEIKVLQFEAFQRQVVLNLQQRQQFVWVEIVNQI